jgi:hypothetical protein
VLLSSPQANVASSGRCSAKVSKFAEQTSLALRHSARALARAELYTQASLTCVAHSCDPRTAITHHGCEKSYR